MITQELLRYARLYGDSVEGVSIDLRIDDRRLSIEGTFDALMVYPSDERLVYAGRSLTVENIPAWFRWLAGLGEAP